MPTNIYLFKFPRGPGSLGLGLGLLVLVPFLYVYRKYQDALKNERKTSINESVFFAPLGLQCKSYKSGLKKFCGSLICNYCSYNKILYYIENTKHHIDVCVYLLTSEEICSALVKLLKKKVYVRIIVDKQMSDEAASAKVLIFRKECVPIKVIETSQIMHNKFAIIDKEIVVTGSCNWTMQGFGGNYENAVITNNIDIAKRFMQYFEELWTEKHTTY